MLEESELITLTMARHFAFKQSYQHLTIYTSSFSLMNTPVRTRTEDIRKAPKCTCSYIMRKLCHQTVSLSYLMKLFFTGTILSNSGTGSTCFMDFHSDSLWRTSERLSPRFTPLPGFRKYMQIQSVYSDFSVMLRESPVF